MGRKEREGKNEIRKEKTCYLVKENTNYGPK
jgi:hypothetical protein